MTRPAASALVFVLQCEPARRLHPVWPYWPEQAKRSGKGRKIRKTRKDRGVKITDASLEIVGNGKMSLMSEANTDDRNRWFSVSRHSK